MYSYEHKSKNKKQKIILEKTFLNWWIMLFLEKLWKMWKNLKKKELSSVFGKTMENGKKHKEEGII